MSSKMKEKELLKRISGLPREIQPDNDPWETIAARLEDRAGVVATPAGQEPSGWLLRSWPVRAVAAAAILAVVLVLVPRQEPVPENTALSGGDATEAAVGTGMPYELAGSEAEYQAAFREFIAVGDSHDQLPAITVETIETGWTDLLQIEKALSDALLTNPNDPFLNKRMLELRARQLGFLRQLAALDHSNRRLTI